MLRGRFQLGVEVGDDVLERRDRGLHRGDAHQLFRGDRAFALLQGDDHIPPQLLKLNKR